MIEIYSTIHSLEYLIVSIIMLLPIYNNNNIKFCNFCIVAGLMHLGLTGYFCGPRFN